MKNRLVSCSQCVFSFYEPNKHSVFSKCRLFGEKFDHKIVHNYSAECRKDETKCGSVGREYRERYLPEYYGLSSRFSCRPFGRSSNRFACSPPSTSASTASKKSKKTSVCRFRFSSVSKELNSIWIIDRFRWWRACVLNEIRKIDVCR